MSYTSYMPQLPSVPTHSLEQPPGYQSTGLKRSVISDKQRTDLLRKQANIASFKKQLESDRTTLDKDLTRIRREEEERQREQEVMDDAELFAEFEKLEKKYPENCKRNKDGKCVIMGGKYKTHKNRTNKRKNKKTQKRRNKKGAKTHRRK
jgi:hypothetical protein